MTFVPGNGFGNKTAGNDVPILRIIPPSVNALSRVTGLDYEAAGTAHTVTFMTVVSDVTPTLTQDVVLNGTVFYLSDAPHDSTGNPPAAGDWFTVRGANKKMYAFKVASYAASPPAITITTTSGIGDANGTGVPVAFPTGNNLWFHGSPTADHPDHGYLMKASTIRTLNMILATSPKINQPILVHSDNAAAAALTCAVSYDNPKV